ncbi:MAG TPA: hypothetical protein VMH36_15840 [Alphaproteobacteria bacterium]|nr:hypothetical protein [Alphaproteobacteria bacterium]
MTDAEIELIARAAGLQTALEQYRADVKAAAEEAERLRAALKGPLTAADEPWPPMTVRKP